MNLYSQLQVNTTDKTIDVYVSGQSGNAMSLVVSKTLCSLI